MSEKNQGLQHREGEMWKWAFLLSNDKSVFAENV